MNRIFSTIAKAFQTICIIAFLLSTYSCEKKESSEKSLTGFVFEISKNPNLSYDVYAEIRDDSILAKFPSKTDVRNLVATFTHKGIDVTVNGVVQASGVTVNDFSRPVQYTVIAEDHSTKTYIASFTIAPEMVTPDREQTISKFEIKRSLNPGLNDDIVFKINHTAQTLETEYLKWINSPVPSQLVISFEAGSADVRINGQTAQSGVTVIDFKHPVHVESVSGDFAPRTYTASILCPQINATLPVLRITSDAPVSSKNYYVKANLEIVGNGISEGLWDHSKGKIEIRLRGNATIGLPKKPYRIKFPEKYSPLGLNHAQERSWVLLANDCDKSLIRNAVAFKISRILGADATPKRFTPSTLFVDVYLNGMYEGAYHLTDQIEIGSGRVDVKSLKNSDAGNTSKISGGYLLELDGFASSEPLHFSTSRGMPVSIHYPNNDDYAPEQITWITNFLAKTETALFSTDFKDPVNGWRKHIDLASWVDYYIISELTGNPDAWWSTYLSKERDVDYFIMGPVWDFDIAFNNDSRIANAPYRLMSEAAHDPKTWIRRFMQDETFKAAIKTRWNMKKNELHEVSNYIDELARLLDMSQKANFKRWDINRQVLGHANPSPGSYQAAISQMKIYIQQRYNYLDTEFNKW